MDGEEATSNRSGSSSPNSSNSNASLSLPPGFEWRVVAGMHQETGEEVEFLMPTEDFALRTAYGLVRWLRGDLPNRPVLPRGLAVDVRTDSVRLRMKAGRDHSQQRVIATRALAEDVGEMDRHIRELLAWRSQVTASLSQWRHDESHSAYLTGARPFFNACVRVNYIRANGRPIAMSAGSFTDRATAQAEAEAFACFLNMRGQHTEARLRQLQARFIQMRSELQQ
eukprot:TRINITY_DN48177_c0_g1_i1.p1 TRINITY_DN48177_c0_g1~~TRINITY_DN48177_c0_g1_i1.p1  ORF type:complete len:225 (-),score=28.13 TRINITY_DN48177_c0_g1_i1:65-739(-)